MVDGGPRQGPAWRWKSGLADAEFDGERVIWDPHSGQVARLDRIGSLVCSGLFAGIAVDRIVDDLAAAFDVPPAVVQGDVEDLFQRLQQMGFVVRPSEDPPTL